MAGTGTAHLRSDAILSVEHLVVEYSGSGGRKAHAVSDVSIDVLDGETVGLVGESGCGKSTLARAILRHIPATAGTARFDGEDLLTLSGRALRSKRIKIQMIFQDPISSLNPRRRIEDIVGEGLRIWKVGSRATRREKVRQIMEAVGLTYDPAARRRRTEFSGGQCQRISIARALVLEPEVVICDEPVSALDVSVQAQILNLLVEMKDRYRLAMLFIGHDLAVVKHISDRIVVMYLGKMCEVATPTALYKDPQHPYTAALLAAIPVPDPASARTPGGDVISGELPSAFAPPSGCRFRTRCPRAAPECAVEEPVLRAIRPDHFVACHFPLSSPPPELELQRAAAVAAVPR